ncbi:MAG: helix-turn-helix domain containing protein [Fibromonadaceae bacterium]|nr:helix-turn-helix domain containing protein [Fibromonadaceae bacterium]
MKKIYTIILALIALCGGFYALVRFSGLNPEEFFPKTPKTTVHGVIDIERMQSLYDSLESINFAIKREEERKDKDDKRIKNLKDTQKNLWERILAARNAISKANNPEDVKEEKSELIDSLIRGISITAAILLVVIIFLIIKITRRSKEVEKVTERLKSLQFERAPPHPRGGMDANQIPTRYRPNPLPQVKPYEQSDSADTSTVERAPATTEQPKLRPTAKQRVTEAVRRMAEALASLRKDGTVKTQIPSEPTAISNKLTKTQIRVQSLNNTRITPPGDETTFDRRGREKKQILDYARQGRTPSEIAKWLNLPRDQVETVIRLARERGE